MTDFLNAHGYDPGPTQRPTLAGCLTGLLATLPAIPVLILFGSAKAEAGILGLSLALTLAAGAVAMAVAGAFYGRIFRRAANDRHGGWLFGMGFGFLLWAGGAVLVLPAVSGGVAPAGTAAVGVAVSLLVWGTTLGALFPYLHQRLHVGAHQWTAQRPGSLGPSAASIGDPPSGRR